MDIQRKAPAQGNTGALGTLQQLRSMQGAAQRNDPKALRAAAQQFEAIFTEQIFKNMRQAQMSEGLGESDSEQLYRGMLDQQMAQKISQGRGMGLADMLVRQLGQQHGGDLTGGKHAFSVEEKRQEGGIRAGKNLPAQSSVAGHYVGEALGAGSARPEKGAMAQAQDFIHSILPAAKEAAKALGVNPLAVLAHAALETGWGKHMAHDAQGRPSLNLFGIKANVWNGAQASASTKEFANGVARMEHAAFRAYKNVTESVQDYAHFLLSNKRYAGVLGHGNDIAGFAKGLQRAGYATDPAYARKLQATAYGKHMRDVLESLGLSLARML